MTITNASAKTGEEGAAERDQLTHGSIVMT
jgi:hypothetical protein